MPAVAILDPSVAYATEVGWNEQCLQWGSVISAGVIPKSTDTASKCIAIAKFGADTFGYSAIESVMKICIVEGKMTLFAETLMGLMLAHANANAEVLQPVERSVERAAIEVKRTSYTASFTFEFTKEDAVTAGLWGGKARKSGKPLPWTLHPRAMLWARVVSVVSRAAYSDVTGGAFVREEFTPDRVRVTVRQLDDDDPLEGPGEDNEDPTK